MKMILIRFDDICPTMNHDQWLRALSVIEKYGIKPLLGVIPECRDNDLLIDSEDKMFWEKISHLQKEGCAIAMHGLYHVYDSKTRGEVNHSFHSEYAGHSFDVQNEKIQKGKSILEKYGIKTDIFFAPAHSYDDNTIKALSANGFKYMFDGLGLKPVNRYGVKCIPCHFCGSKLPFRVKHKTYVFHAHEWATERNAEEYNLFEKVCKENADNIVDAYLYAQQPTGNYYFQCLISRVVVFYNRYLWPNILRVYSIIKRRNG